MISSSEYEDRFLGMMQGRLNRDFSKKTGSLKVEYKQYARSKVVKLRREIAELDNKRAQKYRELKEALKETEN